MTRREFITIAALAAGKIAMGSEQTEWVHPAVEALDSVIADAENGVNPAKILERLRDELRPLVVELAQLDPRD